MSLFAAEWGTGQVFWSILWFFLFFIWLWMLIVVFGDIFRSDDLSGWGKALWSIFIIVVPYLGVFVYLIARGGKMGARVAADAKAQDEAFQQYVRQTAGTSAASTADELERLAQLHDQGSPQRRRVRPSEGQGARLSRTVLTAHRYGGAVSVRYTYSRWDGTQRGFEPDADDILAAVTDDLIEHGDVNAALRRLMNDGLRSADGDAIAGLRELLATAAPGPPGTSRAVRPRRRVRRDLPRARRHRRRGAPRRRSSPRSTNAVRPTAAATSARAEEAARRAEERRLDLDLLPDDLAGKVDRPAAARLRVGEAATSLRGARRAPARPSGDAGVRADERFDAVAEPAVAGAARGDARRSQRDARSSPAWRGSALRRVHGSPRRLLPGAAAEHRRVARDARPAGRGDAGAARLDDAGATRRVVPAVRGTARRRRPARADQPARRAAARVGAR